MSTRINAGISGETPQEVKNKSSKIEMLKKFLVELQDMLTPELLKKKTKWTQSLERRNIWLKISGTSKEADFLLNNK